MVKFGEYLKGCVVERYADKYIKYEELKIALERAKNRMLNGKEEFYRFLDSSYTICKNFAEEWLVGLENIKEWSPNTISSALELNQFVFINQEALRKIVKKHDKNITQERLMSMWKWKMEFHMSQRIIDVLLTAISTRPANRSIQIPTSPSALQTESIAVPVNKKTSKFKKVDDGMYLPLNDDENVSSSAQTKPNEPFSRKSVKYWVHPCDLAAVCASLGENLVVKAFEDASPWTTISSVYLDNTARTCYCQTMNNDGNTRNIRFRTYNSDTSRVFVEMHHGHDHGMNRLNKSSTVDSPTTERFAVDDNQVVPFLRGQTVRVADKFSTLRDELQRLIRDMKLYPTLRVDYTRIAFQPENNDQIRVNVDLNMKLFQERTSHMDWKTPEDKREAEDQVLFPYSIVEVQLQEPYLSNPPEWLLALEAGSLLHREAGFSKYIQGTYAFSFMDGNPLQLRKPMWWDSMVNAVPQIAFKQDASKSVKVLTDKERRLLQSGSGSHWLVKLFGFKSATNEDGKVIKIEPKVFFANERTFLSWLNSSLFVASIGVALAAADYRARVVGGMLVFVGVLLICYAAVTYVTRTSALLQRKAGGYHDRYGPIALSIIVITVFTVAYIISVAP